MINASPKDEKESSCAEISGEIDGKRTSQRIFEETETCLHPIGLSQFFADAGRRRSATCRNVSIRCAVSRLWQRRVYRLGAAPLGLAAAGLRSLIGTRGKQQCPSFIITQVRSRVISPMLVAIPALFAAGAAQAQVSTCAGQTGGCRIDQAQFGNSPATAPIGNDTAGGLTVGYTSTGGLTIENGATVTSGFQFNGIGNTIGDQASGSGTVTVSGLSSAWNASVNALIVGNAGTGTLTIENGATVTSSSGGIIGNAISGVGTATVSGPGSAWNTGSASMIIGSAGKGTLTIENGATVTTNFGDIGSGTSGSGAVTVNGAGSTWTMGGMRVGTQGAGTLTIENGARVINSGNAFIANSSSGSGTVTVSGPGSTWNAGGIFVGYFGAGTLTIADGATVTAPPVTVAAQAGSRGTLNIGAPAGAPAAAPGTLKTTSVGFSAGTGLIVFNHTATDYVLAPGITGPGSVNVLAGTTIFAASKTYTGQTTISGGTLAAGVADVFSAASHTVVQSGGTLALRGFNQTLNNGLDNAGMVQLGVPGVTPPGTTLTVAGNYVGNGGTLSLNTFLGGDGSPSDKLIINGGIADSSLIRITNAGGPGAETTGKGILVVQTINGGTTTVDAFALAGEVRGGAYDYRLFRGSPVNLPDPSVANDWFLRSTFVNGPGPEQPIGPAPPTDPLPPGIWPIIGPELATYGVVQPIARQMGLTTLGTLHERRGDTAADAACSNDNCRSPVWGRLFGQQINNRYQAFADPHASGQVAGIQSGADIWRGSLIPGHSDAAGLYFAYGNGNASVNGLVTNPAATAYVLQHTGSLNLNAYSLGGYWTHYGPTGWYIDAVLQGSFYSGNGVTQFANLPIGGTGFTSSLEAGYPISLPWFGPGFVLEPQGQIIWQRVSFRDDNDGLGPVGLGTTSGATGRLGMRGKWTITDSSERVWQPYVLANVWRDWGANATTTFGGDPVLLSEQATRLEFAGGLSAKLLPGVSLYAQGGYQFAVSGTDGGRRDGVRGDLGLHYTW
ncbi:outer membrane autotransporter barrel domain-containing protein [Bradyrhizobium sp. NFR13]|uniref:autotransporter family protein n=1 Tax=Bradyrhizobium sp. NFR13 TaxID=1566285 RepID=UPI0008EF7627|nr:autotransporter outer membrane beta-barrel domain-containing protein [Bradyrhizobium sp. NFR13]SFL62419.1 outer membrane autotransporter barrel domain-containing protein [Bradyrhizobium sp. NFR13]